MLLYLGVLISTGLIAALAIMSGSRQQSQQKISSGLVTGIILGTLVGGACTVGTAQMAFSYGICAWWFSISAAIACFVLALIFAVPLRREDGKTLMGMLTGEFGPRIGVVASVLNSLGTFINILVQLIAATAVIAVIFPDMSLELALVLSAAFMVLYVVFGGTRGAGMVGILKLILIYVSMMACGIIVLQLTDGLSGFIAMVDAIPRTNNEDFFNFFARGWTTDFGASLALVVGVTTTQIYAQAITSATTDKSARFGACLSGLLIPLIGAGGILVGLFMRAHYPTIAAKCALTEFVLLQMPDFLAGIVLGTIFIATIGTGAGLSLGVSTVIQKDLISERITKALDGKGQHRLLQVIIVALLAAATLCCMALENDLILGFAYLSMALRGTVVFAPLVAALWFKDKVKSEYALAATLLGPAIVIALRPFDLPINPLFIALAVTLATVALGYKKDKTLVA